MEIFGNGIMICMKKEQNNANPGIIDLRDKKSINELLNNQKSRVLRGGSWLSNPRSAAVVRIVTGAIPSTAATATAFGLSVGSPRS